MKTFVLTNDSYQELLNSFKAWLTVLGYSKSSINSLPSHVQEFLYFLETRGVSTIGLTTAQDITDYETYLSIRSNKLFAGGLQASTLHYHFYAIRLFNQFLHKHGFKSLVIDIKPERIFREAPIILTVEEVKELFEQAKTSKSPQCYRDEIILVCLYSLGLRLHEAQQLQISDIDLTYNRVVIRRGKNGKQRQVPFNNNTSVKLEEYMYCYRRLYSKSYKSDRLLIGIKGILTDDGIRQALERMVRKSKIEKKIYPHLLRHSIASHLLEKGMKLNQIQQFLGHSSLESTQIYTHLIVSESD